MENIILIPTKLEMDLFLKRCKSVGLKQNISVLGSLEVIELPGINAGIAPGGLGKVQFGVQTQYLISKVEPLGAVLCVGAAGALAGDIKCGDIVVATETVEHDIRKFGRPLIPRFRSSEFIVDQFRELAGKQTACKLHFGAIASGDEDILDGDRREELRSRTGALATAWEGAGGARACRFSNVPYVEVRGITDLADTGAVNDFYRNLETVMGRLADLIIEWAASFGL
jgi:adenosylhomocysteine nucleosidase